MLEKKEKCMKLCIDTVGTICIERAKTITPQICAYKNKSCGDHCVLFNEPIIGKDFVQFQKCNGQLIVVEKHEFEDQRNMEQ